MGCGFYGGAGHGGPGLRFRIRCGWWGEGELRYCVSRVEGLVCDGFAESVSFWVVFYDRVEVD